MCGIRYFLFFKKALVILFLILGLFCCDNSNQNISVSLIALSCMNGNQVTDTLDNLIQTFKPDILSYKCSSICPECSTLVIDNNYQLFNLNTIQENDNYKQSYIAFKNNLFDLQSSGEIVYKDSLLNKDGSFLNWIKLKDTKLGYIFFVFNLSIYYDLTKSQADSIGSKILKKIDETSSGAPVILISKLKSDNYLNYLISQEWKGLYTLNKVENLRSDNATFFINDFFTESVKNGFLDEKNGNNELILKFNKKIKKITKNEDGIEMK